MTTPVDPTPAVEPSSPVATEPVNVVQLVHLVLAALVTLGWVNIDNALIDTIGTVVAGALSIGAQLWARNKVVPVAKVGLPPTEHPGA